MKKFAIFILVVIVIVSGISYIYLNYVANYNIATKENKLLENYYNQEVYGADVATVINKAIDNNETNKIQKDSKGKYIQNDENSIKVDIKFIDDDKVYDMEKINKGGIENFIKYYNTIKFKCTTIQYHPLTNKIKYMYFEQITK